MSCGGVGKGAYVDEFGMESERIGEDKCSLLLRPAVSLSYALTRK